jgi:hypothetical protein
VGSQPEDRPLLLKVARGTHVEAQHEAVLVDLCSSPEYSDAETENCVIDFLKGGYDAPIDDDGESDVCDDEDTECLVANMYSMWDEDMPAAQPSKPVTEPEEEKQPVKPWSSRSSGSGTYVRDPATGEMKNIG